MRKRSHCLHGSTRHHNFDFGVRMNDTPAQGVTVSGDASRDALKEARQALEAWVGYAEENLSEFDADEDCEAEKLCPRCQSSGCITGKIRDARSAIAAIHRSALQPSHSPVVNDVDPNDVWEAYVADTPFKGRSPQGAVAFAVDYLQRQSHSPAATSTKGPEVA